MRHLMISAAHKSSGKTTISIGLCAALTRQGEIVQPFKKGPDYIDPMWLGAAAGRNCYNLDYYTMQKTEISSVFQQKMAGTSLGLIEGNKGLYDGLDLDGSNSNAALAVQLDAPVILVLDTRGMTRGIAPLILGYQAFEKNINIAGIILNSVGGSRHEKKLRDVIEHYTDARVIGAVPRNKTMQITERHLGLMPENEQGKAEKIINDIADIVEQHVDLEQLLSIAAETPTGKPQSVSRLPANPVVVGYAQDSAFGFYYPGDLEAFHAAGAVLQPIDMLNDKALPKIDALFIGGGFPETHLEALHANQAMRSAIKDYIENDGVVYAECGGLMYLARSIRWQDQCRDMVGIIDADVIMHEKPQGRGYVQLKENLSHPWLAGDNAPQQINAHEFHYSGLDNFSTVYQYAYDVKRGFGINGKKDGLIYKNLLANYTHLRNTENNPWVRRFVEKARHSRID